MIATYFLGRAIGTVSADPVISKISTGLIATLTIYVSVSCSDAASSQGSARVEWHQLIAAGSMARRIEHEVRKGCRIRVEGDVRSELRPDPLTKQDRLVTRLLVRAFEVISTPIRREAPARPAPPAPSPIPTAEFDRQPPPEDPAWVPNDAHGIPGF